jgi:hypothetical protein
MRDGIDNELMAGTRQGTSRVVCKGRGSGVIFVGATGASGGGGGA